MITLNVYNIQNKMNHTGTFPNDMPIKMISDMIKHVLNGEKLQLEAKPLNIKRMKLDKQKALG